MFILLGFAAGLVSAMPLGPISAMAISYRLHGRAREGRAVALAASFCDFVYALLAILAAAELTAFFNRLGVWMHMGGGVLLAGLAVAFFLKSGRLVERSVDPGIKPRRSSPAAVTVLLYIVNPTIILYWIALVRGFLSSGVIPGGTLPALVFSACVGLGGWLWFKILFHLLDRSRGRIGVTLFRWILRGLAVLLAGLALRSFFQAASFFFGRAV